MTSHTPDVHPGGSSWALSASTATIQTNRLRFASGLQLATIDAQETFNASRSAAINCRAWGAATTGDFSIGFLLRYVDASNYLYAVAEPNQIRITKRVAGVETDLDTYDLTGAGLTNTPIAQGQVVELWSTKDNDNFTFWIYPDPTGLGTGGLVQVEAASVTDFHTSTIVGLYSKTSGTVTTGNEVDAYFVVPGATTSSTTSSSTTTSTTSSTTTSSTTTSSTSTTTTTASGPWFRDTYADTDGTNLSAHTPDIPGSGTYSDRSGNQGSGAGRMQVKNTNKCRYSASGQTGSAYFDVGNGGHDVDMFMWLDYDSSKHSLLILPFRFAAIPTQDTPSTENGWRAMIYNTGSNTNLYFLEVISGSNNVRSTNSLTSFTTGPVILKVKVRDHGDGTDDLTLEAWVSGSSVGNTTFNSASYRGNTIVGVHCQPLDGTVMDITKVEVWPAGTGPF